MTRVQGACHPPWILGTPACHLPEARVGAWHWELPVHPLPAPGGHQDLPSDRPRERSVQFLIQVEKVPTAPPTSRLLSPLPCLLRCPPQAPVPASQVASQVASGLCAGQAPRGLCHPSPEGEAPVTGWSGRSWASCFGTKGRNSGQSSPWVHRLFLPSELSRGPDGEGKLMLGPQLHLHFSLEVEPWVSWLHCCRESSVPGHPRLEAHLLSLPKPGGGDCRMGFLSLLESPCSASTPQNQAPPPRPGK